MYILKYIEICPDLPFMTNNVKFMEALLRIVLFSQLSLCMFTTFDISTLRGIMYNEWK